MFKCLYMPTVALLAEILVFIAMVVVYQPHKNISKYKFCDFAHTDTLRGIAILMIILMHSSGALGTRVFTPLGV